MILSVRQHRLHVLRRQSSRTVFKHQSAPAATFHGWCSLRNPELSKSYQSQSVGIRSMSRFLNGKQSSAVHRYEFTISTFRLLYNIVLMDFSMLRMNPIWIVVPSVKEDSLFVTIGRRRIGRPWHIKGCIAHVLVSSVPDHRRSIWSPFYVVLYLVTSKNVN